MSEMEWNEAKERARGVRERGFALRCDGRRVPGLLWTPEGASSPLPLVLLGHGGSGHKREPHLLAFARRLVRHLCVAAAAIDGPIHGDRRPEDLAPDAVEETRRRFARPEVADTMVADWKAAIDALQKEPELGGGGLGYWGLSMGTLFGVPLLAAEPRIRVAVLGLLGIRPDGGRIAARLASDAPQVRCPVLFLQQRQDELFPVATSGALFDALGSPDARLHAHPGQHAAVPPEGFGAAEAFLGRHLRPPPSRSSPASG